MAPGFCACCASAGGGVDGATEALVHSTTAAAMRRSRAPSLACRETSRTAPLSRVERMPAPPPPRLRRSVRACPAAVKSGGSYFVVAQAWTGWRLLVPGRDVREGRRTLVLPVPRNRPRRRASGFHAQRASRQAWSSSLPQMARRSDGAKATVRHHRQAPLVLQGDPMDPRQKVLHRSSQYLNNLTEQSDRAVKQRYYLMLGFGSFESAARFCSAFDEPRQYFRVRRRGQGRVTLAEQRRLFLARWRSLIAELAAA